jgi:hypothetical protein
MEGEKDEAKSKSQTVIAWISRRASVFFNGKGVINSEYGKNEF